MHYAPVISNFVTPAPPRSKLPTEVDLATAPRWFTLRTVAGAWRNWWNMSVQEAPAPTATATRLIGARGRTLGL